MFDENDGIAERIGRAQALAFNGDSDGARALYRAWWDDAMRVGDHYQACIVAHFLAHAQDEVGDQLEWHLRSLAAADVVGDDRVRAFYPSLYANVAEVCLRLGNVAAARTFVVRARAAAPALPDDGYGRMIRALIERLERDAATDHLET